MENILKSLSTTDPDTAVRQYLGKIMEVNPGVQAELIRDAFLFSWEAHKDQLRKSGEPFLAHPMSVAFILAEQKLDSVTIAAALLHDVIEDTDTSKEDLAARFGAEVAELVDGVTKINVLQSKSRQERQAETYRKMLLSMARDIRVIIIKFADRIHNLRTLKYLEPEKIKAIATETLDIYSPLALRLGMAKIKCELDDLAFKHLHPEEYKDIVAKVAAGGTDREAMLEAFAAPLRAKLEQEGVAASITGRPKHFYSIYNKMMTRNKPFEEIYDILAIRIIVNSVRDCYLALGAVHSLWTPIQERFKDYVSAPKNNGYQSLHTTVVSKEGATQGSAVEMQIRTWEMNKTAEEGIGAHWLYKNGGEGIKEISKDDKALEWLRNIIEWQENLTDFTEFYEFFKIDLFDAEVFVFTPQGNLISLPKGATVLDFAFNVHTQLGIHCIGAKIDGNIESAETELKSGQTVEVMHLNSKTPTAESLRNVKTAKARAAIRHWLKNTKKQESIDIGRRIIQNAYDKLHANSPFNDHLPELLQYLGLGSVERLYELVGGGDLPENRVMKYFQTRKIKRDVPSQMISRFVSTLTGKQHGILVGGQSNMIVRFAECCNPIPGDPITGFLTRGRGIAVHRADCPNAELFADDEERQIEVNWDGGEQKIYSVLLEITSANRTGMLYDISEVFAEFGVNISGGSITTHDKRAKLSFRVEIRNQNQLKQFFRRLQKIKGVENVTRVKDYIAQGL